MPQISRAYIDAFSKQLDALNVSAGKVIFTEEKRLELTRRLLDGEAESFEDVIKLMHSVCGSYNKLASSLTCHFYDGIRQASGVPGDFHAEMYDGYDTQEITAAARSVAEEVAMGRNTVPLSNLMSNIASGEMKKANERTMRNNARRDPSKPRYCIVPAPGACAFCQMRASLGYQYPDRANIESHSGCTCAAVQVYSGQKVQGYDPSDYLDKYNAAKDAYERGEIPDDLARRIDSQRDAKGDDFDKTNAVLMVMRYQQGIK